MRPLLLLIMSAVLVAQTPQNAPPPFNLADAATVEGSIVSATQNRPLEGIPVTLRTEDPGRAAPRSFAVTDSAGQFRLTGVPPGDYIVDADRTGYFRAEDNPVRIRVGPKAQIRGVALRMILAGSISGRILDINNLGLAGVQVVAMQVGYLYPSGKRQFQQRSVAFTSDDRGDFQVRGLRPGPYYLKASLDFQASDSFAYYPGTKDELGATPVVVREGEDAIADLRLEVKMKPTFTISGVVASAPGVPNQPVLRIFLAQGSDGGTPHNNVANDRSNGRFEIRNIFAGTYEVYPEMRDADGRLYTSRTTVDLVNRNIENLPLPAVPTSEVKGRVLLNGEAPRLPGQDPLLSIETVRGLSPFVISRSTNRGNSAISATNPPVDRETGEFTIAGLPPGTYKLSLPGMPLGAYLEDLRQGNVSVYDEGFSVTEGQSGPIQLLLASPGGRIEGVVRGVNQEPVATVRVVLIPQGLQRQDMRRFNSTSSDKDGKFVLYGIPPGSYKMFAIDNFPENAWRNAEFMQKYDSRGQTLNVGKGAVTTVELPRIPWEVTP